MTQSEFIEFYCKNSNITEDKINQLGQIAVPCNCGETDCKGWSMIHKSALLTHAELYASCGVCAYCEGTGVSVEPVLTGIGRDACEEPTEVVCPVCKGNRVAVVAIDSERDEVYEDTCPQCEGKGVES